MRSILARLLTAAIVCYLVGAILFSALQLGATDRWWWLFLLSSIGVYLYAPLLILLPLTLLLRRWRLAGMAVAALCGGALIYGSTLLTAPEPTAQSSPPLTIMTFNMYGFNRETALVIAAIRQSGADVVGLQELNTRVASAIDDQLRADYPYQLLSPDRAVLGMGVISKYPITSLGTLPGERWTGDPQIVEVQLADGPVRLVNFHAIAPLGPPAEIQARLVLREQQMRTLAAYAAHAGVPVIATGDMNTPPGSRAQRAATAVLRDSWAERGGSLGATWPSQIGHDAQPPAVFGISLPLFFVRIDYILHTAEFTPVWVRQGPVFTGSDHRAVIAQLVR